MATWWIILAQFVCVQFASGDVVNVALNKPVNMSSQFRAFTPATKAVDGNKGTNGVINEINFMNTDLNKAFAWWWVDLQSQVKDATVKIYFRTDYKIRRNGVQLYTSTKSFNTYPSGDLCYNVTGRPNGTDIPDIVSVNCSGTWRYLMVYTDTDNSGKGDGAILDFGEVEVLVCPAGTYGNSCSQRCSDRHCMTSSDTCDLVNGVCLSGCLSGWNGTDCKLQCLTGTYGVNCVKSCSARQCRTPSSPCNHMTGLCPDGCLDGWSGQDCSTECPKDTFGLGCMSCSTRQCQGESDCPGDGTCSGGCQDGWTLDSCTQACPSGTYGTGCRFTCGNCTGDSICNHVTGNCPGDCKAGWQGSLCKQTCPNGKYGVNCMETCVHCADTCDVVDGHCLGGCEEGFCGDQCHLRLISDTGVDSVSAVIGAVIGAVVMFVVIGAVLFCLLRYGRLQWMTVSRSKDSTQPREMTDIARPHDVSHGVPERSGSSHTYNNDYAVLDTDNKSDSKDYDVIKSKQYENL